MQAKHDLLSMYAASDGKQVAFRLISRQDRPHCQHTAFHSPERWLGIVQAAAAYKHQIWTPDQAH